ncbi:MAG: hypothetical protein HW380_1431 [Magnetococcales bacterium]|nr:hypothetical protein [Magnetococcales bacterium]
MEVRGATVQTPRFLQVMCMASGIAVALFAKSAKRATKGAPPKTFSLREKVYCEGGRKIKDKVKNKVKNKTLGHCPKPRRGG